MRLTICHFDLRFFIVHNFSNNAVSWHSRHNGGSISQMDRLRLSYACLYISRKSETPSFVSPVLSPRVLILPTEESTRIVVERLEISGGKEGKRGFRGGKKRRGEVKTNSLRNSVSGNNEQGSILTCRRKGRFAGRTISNCAL